MKTAQWLKGNGGTEFLQFAAARITRSRFPLGGYLYRTTKSDGSGDVLYSGNDESHARLAAKQAGAA